MEDLWQTRLERIEGILEEVLPTLSDQDWATVVAGEPPVLEDLTQLDAINAPGRELVHRGGKRWRPLVMVLCAEGAGNGEAAYGLSPLVELPHNGSLIVDDIEDHAEERRG